MPLSSAVREVLTELGLDFVARQVEPWPGERDELRRVAGTDQIPVLPSRGRPTLSRHPEDLRAPARARAVGVRGRPPAPVCGPLGRARVRRTGAVARVLPRDGRARSRHGIAGRGGGGGRAAGEPLRAPARRTPDRAGGVQAAKRPYRLHSHRGRRRPAKGAASAAASQQRHWRTRVGKVSRSFRSALFIAHYIESRPEFDDLVASGYRDRPAKPRP